MVRYSYNFSFIPRAGRPTEFVFYFSATKWINEKAVDNQEIFRCDVRNVDEVIDPAHILGNGQAMADLSYQLVSEQYARYNNRHAGETNARPSNTSTN